MFKKFINNINLDTCRLIAAFMIVAVHIYPFASFSEDFDYLFTRVMFRIAVPLFLMITGYYLLPRVFLDVSNLWNYIKKIIKLYVISMVIYLPINIYNGYFKDFSLLKIIKNIFIDGTFLHLWYFPALVLGLIVSYYIIKKFDSRVVWFIFGFLFIVGLFGDSYYGFISGISILKGIYDVIFRVFNYTRNGLFYVPIFLYMGYVVSLSKLEFSNKRCLFLMTLFFIMMVLEGEVLYYFDIPRHTSMYLFLLPFSYVMFYFLVNNVKGSNKFYRDISTWVYVLHPLFIVIVHLLARIIGVKMLINNSLINYIVVCIMTYVFILIVNKLLVLVKDKIKLEKIGSK